MLVSTVTTRSPSAPVEGVRPEGKPTAVALSGHGVVDLVGPRAHPGGGAPGGPAWRGGPPGPTAAEGHPRRGGPGVGTDDVVVRPVGADGGEGGEGPARARGHLAGDAPPEGQLEGLGARVRCDGHDEVDGPADAGAPRAHAAGGRGSPVVHTRVVRRWRGEPPAATTVVCWATSVPVPVNAWLTAVTLVSIVQLTPPLAGVHVQVT